MRRIGYSLKKAKAQETEINPDDCLAKTDGCDMNGFSIPGMTVYQHCRGTGLVASSLKDMFPYLDVKGFFPKGFQLIAALHEFAPRMWRCFPGGSGAGAGQVSLLHACGDVSPSRILHSVG